MNKVDILFSDDFAANTCTVKIIEGDPKYDGLCYHNPIQDQNVFFS